MLLENTYNESRITFHSSSAVTFSAAMLKATAATDASNALNDDAEDTPADTVEPSENGNAHKEERRKVRQNNMVVYQSASYGPLPQELAGETVQLRVGDNGLEIRTDTISWGPLGLRCTSKSSTRIRLPGRYRSDFT